MRRWLPRALAICAWPGPALAQPLTNGQPAAGDPAVIALVDASGDLGCTASAIGPHTAITAAHCIDGRDPRTLRAFIGNALADGGTWLAVSHGRMHPGFDPGGRDVAMLTLRDACPVPPLALEPAALDGSLVGTTFRVVGFGITGQGLADAGVKREGTARVAALRAEELIAVPAPSLSCLGDSGGPALLPAGTIAGVVSRGDSACRDHAVYTRIDAARALLVDPYLADTAPGTAAVGSACYFEGHCLEGACLRADDDPLLYFCSRSCTRDADCPAPMECAVDGCRWAEPSPGALGSPCAADAECTSGLCRGDLCTRSCAQDACPAGFECRATEAGSYCVAASGGCGCASGSGPGAAIAFVMPLMLRGRRARARPP